MKTRWMTWGFLLLLLTGLAACTHKPTQVVPQVSLAQELDQLYQTDRVAWRNAITAHLESGGVDLPVRHLIQAVKVFNQSQSAELCLDAAYRYLYVRAREQHGLPGEEAELLKVYVEYVLRHPKSQPIERLRDLCGYTGGSLCDGLG